MTRIIQLIMTSRYSVFAWRFTKLLRILRPQKRKKKEKKKKLSIILVVGNPTERNIHADCQKWCSEATKRKASKTMLELVECWRYVDRSTLAGRE